MLKGPLAGALFENYILQELIKYYFAKGEQPPIYYFRSNNQLEVDLLIETDMATLRPIEIKLSSTPKPQMAHGIQRLTDLLPQLIFQNAAVLCTIEKTRSLSESVWAMNLETLLANFESRI